MSGLGRPRSIVGAPASPSRLSGGRGGGSHGLLPGPVTRKRRAQGLTSAPGASTVQAAVVLLLCGGVAYGIYAGMQLSRSHTALSGPHTGFFAGSGQLQGEDITLLSDSLDEVEEQIAKRVEAAAREMMEEKLHEASQEIVHLMEEKLSSKSGEPPSGEELTLEQAYDALHVPYDLRFTGMKEFAEHNMRRATQELAPRKIYEGPLDLDDLVETRALEIEAEWRAAGSPEKERPGYIIASWREMPKLPYNIISDWYGKETGVLGVTCPYLDEYYGGEMERGAFWWLKNAGYIAIGVMSFEHFPEELHNPYDGRHVRRNPDDWAMFEALDGWLHCARDPGAVLPAGVPRVLTTRDVKKDTPELARYVDSGQLVYRPFEGTIDWLADVARSRAMFTPSVADASPRSAAEALALNVPGPDE
eukprot:jgi/Tetstr1/442224/TSEL_003180.t1